MIYIDATPNTSGAYPNPKNQPFPGCIPLTDEQTDTFLAYNGFVVVTKEQDPETEAITYKVAPNTEAWEAWKAAQPDPLVEGKAARVAQSKADLETYLNTHPITWTDGQQYSITRDKQQQLTSKILSATIAQQTSTPYTLTWNSTGAECTAWELPELMALAFAIDARVTALVSYQQAQEIAINAAQTQEDLDAIVVDYDTVEASL